MKSEPEPIAALMQRALHVLKHNNTLAGLIAASRQQQLLYSTEYRHKRGFVTELPILGSERRFLDVGRQCRQGCAVPATTLEQSGLLRTQ